MDWAVYTGPNAHEHHVHVSVLGDASKYDDAAPWDLGSTPALTGGQVTRPILKHGDRGPDVVELQAALGMPTETIDGVFGNNTEHAVREFQSANHLRIDGIFGPKCWAAMLKK